MTNTLKLRRVRLVTVDFDAPESTHPAVHGPEDAFAIARAVLPTDREGVAVFHLNARHEVLSVELAHVGSVNASIVHPREVFKAAILANAVAIVVAHNHPSGDPEPSNEDFAITRRLVKAGDTLGIEVLDSVIVAKRGAVSLKAREAL